MKQATFTRRAFVHGVSVAASSIAVSRPLAAVEADKKSTRFQPACMTLPYSDFTLERALDGIANSGFEYVAWGTRHVDKSGQRVPVMDIVLSLSSGSRGRC